MTHAWERGVVFTGFWLGWRKRPLGRLRRRWEDNIKMDLRRWGSMGRTGFSWLRISSSGELL
jgi:hypothetical protein